MKFSFDKWGIHWYWGGPGGGISQQGRFIYDGDFKSRFQIDVYGYPKQATTRNYGLFIGGLEGAVEIT
ncbi:MAG: hypothetical protein AB8W32_10900 [Arsenophonus endosymbiont of Dermacentor nuttalli]